MQSRILKMLRYMSAPEPCKHSWMLERSVVVLRLGGIWAPRA